MTLKLIDAGLSAIDKGKKYGAGLAMLSWFAKQGRTGVLNFTAGGAELRLLVKKTVGFLYELLWVPKQFAANPTQDLGAPLSSVIQLRTFSARFYQYGVVIWSISETGVFGPPVVHSLGPAAPGEQMEAHAVGIYAVTENSILFSAAPAGWTGLNQYGDSSYFLPGPYYPHTDVSNYYQHLQVFIRPGTLDSSGVSWHGLEDIARAPYNYETCELKNTIMLYEKFPAVGAMAAYGWHVRLWTFRGRNAWERLHIPRPIYASNALIHADFAGLIGICWSQSSDGGYWAQFDYYDENGVAVLLGPEINAGGFGFNAIMSIGRHAVAVAWDYNIGVISFSSSMLVICLPSGQTTIPMLVDLPMDTYWGIGAGIGYVCRYGIEGGAHFSRMTVHASSDNGSEDFYGYYQISPAGELVDYTTSYAWFNGAAVPLAHQVGTVLITKYAPSGKALIYGNGYPAQFYLESEAGLNKTLPVNITEVFAFEVSSNGDLVLFNGWGGTGIVFDRLYRGNDEWTSLSAAWGAKFSNDDTRLVAYEAANAVLWSLVELDAEGKPTQLASADAASPYFGDVDGVSPYANSATPPAVVSAKYGGSMQASLVGNVFFDTARAPYVFSASPLFNIGFETLHYYPAVAEPASPARYVANLVAFEYGTPKDAVAEP